MKRNSSKESLDDYFWDDLDETGGGQVEESLISLLTKGKSNADADNKAQAECIDSAMVIQDLIHKQDSYPSKATSENACSDVKKEGSVFFEEPAGHLDTSPALDSETSPGNKRIAQRPEKADIEDLLYSSKASGEDGASSLPASLTSVDVVLKHGDKDHESPVQSASGRDRKAPDPSEDNNELPNFFWENGDEDGTDFEAKLSLLTLNAKSENDSEYSSLLSKLSTEALLCSMSEASRNPEDMLGVAGFEETVQNSPFSFEEKSSTDIATPCAPLMAEKHADGDKVAADKANREICGDTSDSVKEAAGEKREVEEPHKVHSEKERLIPKSGGRELVADDFGFNFREYPRILYLQGRLLVAHPAKQKRLDVRSGAEREFVSTLFLFFALDYHLPSILDLDCSSILENEPMLSVLFSKNTTIDQIISAVNPGRIRYVVSDIGDSKGNANDIVEMFFLNREVAIRHALSNRQWAFALFLSHNTRHQDEVLREFSMHLNPALHPFFGYGEMSDDWRQTFSLLMRNPQDHLIDTLLSSLHGIELLFTVLSFYFAHSRQFSSRRCFNNFFFLKLALRYRVEAEDLDLLILRYLRVMQEVGKDDASKVYHKYKSRKGVGQWEPKKGWLEGIRHVVEKGISRIVGVDEDILQQDDGHANASQINHGSRMSGDKRDVGHVHYEYRSVLSSQQGGREGQASQGSDGTKRTYAREGRRETQCLQQVETAANATDEMNHFECQDAPQTCTGNVEDMRQESTVDDKVLQNDAVFHDKEAQASPDSQKMQGDSEYKPADGNAERNAPKTWSSVYRSEERSQSCADLSSLLPADILQEEASAGDSKKNGEKKTGFFSRFSLFSKKKTYRVNLDSSEDFKYDPVSKKWTGCTSTGSGPSPPTPVKKEMPKPSMTNIRKVNVALDGSIKSRYTNNVNVEGEMGSLASLLPKKK